MGGRCQTSFHARAETDVCPEIHVMLCSLQQMSWNTVLCQRCWMLTMRPLEPAARTSMCMPSIRCAHYSLLPRLDACLHCCTVAPLHAYQCKTICNLTLYSKSRAILGLLMRLDLQGQQFANYCIVIQCHQNACMTCLYPVQPPLQFKAV